MLLKSVSLWVVASMSLLLACAGSQESASSPSNVDSTASDVEESDPSSGSNSTSVTEIPTTQQGALVTSDCLYQDYGYAIDILLSCGGEEFDAALRLHTFKKHTYGHRAVFNDQLLTYRDGQLWFDAYDTPLCAQAGSDGQLGLAEESQACSTFDLIGEGATFAIQNRNSGLCAGLGGSVCENHRSTGGSECGGVSHRYLPLMFGDCADALQFTFRTEVDTCDNEYPGDACFNL